jgi:hypothetical protein
MAFSLSKRKPIVATNTRTMECHRTLRAERIGSTICSASLPQQQAHIPHTIEQHARIYFVGRTRHTSEDVARNDSLAQEVKHIRCERR